MEDVNDYLIEDWWMPDQKELVEDSSRNWDKRLFKTSSGFWIQVEGGKLMSKLSDQDELPPNSVINETGWDHEHCELCFQKISGYEGDQPLGYTDGKEWVCIDCFDKYIGPRRKQDSA